MENKKLILDKENIKYMLEKTLNFSSKKKQRSENSSCINDNTISKEKTWSSEKISDFTLKNIDTTWTEVKGTNPSVNFTKEGHMKEVEIFGNTTQSEEDLSDIRHIGEYDEESGKYKVEVESSDVGLGRELVVSDVLGTHHSATWQTFQMDFSIIDKIKNILGDEVRHGMAKKQYDYYLVDDNTKGWIAIVKNGESFPTKKDIITELNKKIKSSKQTLLLPCQLMKVGDVQDRLYWNGEKYVIEKNVGYYKMTLDTYSIEQWGLNSDDMKTFGFRQYGKLPIPNYYSDTRARAVVLSPQFKFSEIDKDEEIIRCMYPTNGLILIGVRVNKSTLNPPNLEGVKKWYKENPFFIYYRINPQLIKTEVVEQIFPLTYKDKTHFFVKGGLDGEIKGKVPVDAGKAISVLTERNNTLKKESEDIQFVNKVQEELINISMLATDEMYVMLEPLLSDETIETFNIDISSKIVSFYVAMIRKGLKTLENIPKRYKLGVEQMLTNLE